MRNLSYLMMVLFGLSTQAFSAAYVAVVKDFSKQAQSEKSFLIIHPDGKAEQLEYPETRLRAGDTIKFPANLTLDSKAEVKVHLFSGEDKTIHRRESPWLVPSEETGAMQGVSSAVSSFYAYLFKRKIKARYTQALSRGGSKPTPLQLPFAVYHRRQFIRDNNKEYTWFWKGGKPPFSLEVIEGDKHKVINNYMSSEMLIGDQIVHVARLPVAGLSSRFIQYVLRDRTGVPNSFEVQITRQYGSIDKMILELDQQVRKDSQNASWRLMLWNEILALPENSSRRDILSWMLINQID